MAKWNDSFFVWKHKFRTQEFRTYYKKIRTAHSIIFILFWNTFEMENCINLHYY